MINHLIANNASYSGLVGYLTFYASHVITDTFLNADNWWIRKPWLASRYKIIFHFMNITISTQWFPCTLVGIYQMFFSSMFFSPKLETSVVPPVFSRDFISWVLKTHKCTWLALRFSSIVIIKKNPSMMASVNHSLSKRDSISCMVMATFCIVIGLSSGYVFTLFHGAANSFLGFVVLFLNDSAKRISSWTVTRTFLIRKQRDNIIFIF